MEAMQAIKEGIFSGEFETGQALPNEKELANILGVSRPVLREALRALQIQGFLDVRRGNRGGTYVTDLSNISIRDNLEDLLRTEKISMKDLTQARLLVEPEVFRLAALKANDKQLKQMAEVIQKSGETEDFKKRIELESDFHRLVAKSSGNPLYLRFMQTIFDFVEVFAIKTKSFDFGIHKKDEHLELFNALSRKDDKQAAHLAKIHVEKVNRGMIKIEKLWLKAIQDR
jgi:DNA-binding FadR family transcriptional regulator